jgi:Tfp pilus assembly protein PilF
MTCLILLLLADIITLKNGERYEGRIVKKFAGTVQIETANGVVEVDEADISKIEEKPWTPPEKPNKKKPEADNRKVAGWPDVQPPPKLDLRSVFRDPFVNFRILFPEGWQFQPGDAGVFNGRGPAGQALTIRVEKKSDKTDGEDIKLGALPAKRIVQGEQLLITAIEGDRTFTLTGPKDDTVEAILRSVRIFPENPFTPEKKKEFDDRYKAALNEMNAQNWPAGLKELEKARDVVPNYPEAHNLIYRACTYIQSEWKKGADALRAAVKLDPDNFEYRFYLSRILLSLRKYSDAEKEALEAVKLEPWREPAWTNLGSVMLLEQNFKKAKEALRRALEIDPKSVAATYNLGVCFESEGKFADAEAAYQATLKLQPDHADAKAGLDRIAHSKKK